MKVFSNFIFIYLITFLGACGEGSQSSGNAESENLAEKSEGQAILNPMPENFELKLLKKGFGFSEGPVWNKKQQKLYFSDVILSKTWTLSLPDEFEVFREKTELANGLAFAPNGDLIVAQQKSRSLNRVTEAGELSVITDNFKAKKYQNPNDIAVRSDSTIYFTDPPYLTSKDQQELDFNGVFKVDPNGSVTAIWKGSLESRPNGITLSPDEKRLYFADMADQKIYVSELNEDGSAKEFKLFVETKQAGPDGMCIDVQENLYFATQTGIEIFSKAGKYWGTINVEPQPTNCNFGGADGKTLFITARTHLYMIKDMPLAGAIK